MWAGVESGIDLGGAGTSRGGNRSDRECRSSVRANCLDWVLN